MYNYYNPYSYSSPYGYFKPYPSNDLCQLKQLDNYNNYIQLRDYGPNPFVINIEDATRQNSTFRTALWTGNHLQLTLMSINVGEDIGLEMHPNIDQFIRIEQGQGLVLMGHRRDRLDYQRRVYDDYVIIIPAGTWHNLVNTGYKPLKLYSIYAPPQHPYGTVHRTKSEAEAAERNHSYQYGKATLPKCP